MNRRCSFFSICVCVCLKGEVSHQWLVKCPKKFIFGKWIIKKKLVRTLIVCVPLK